MIVLIVVIVVISSSGGSDNDSTASTAAPSAGSAQAAGSATSLEHSEDVEITSCGPDSAGWAAAKVTVTNHSSKPSNYMIEVAMESPDGKTQIGTGLVAVNNLAPGRQSVEDASSLKDATGPYTCRITDITRYAA